MLISLVLLRLCRPALAELARQEDEGRHLEELALPVLERRLDEVARAEVFRPGQGWVAVLALFLVVVEPPGDALAGPRNEEQRRHRQRQPVVAPHPSHAAAPFAPLPAKVRTLGARRIARRGSQRTLARPAAPQPSTIRGKRAGPCATRVASPTWSPEWRTRPRCLRSIPTSPG